MLRRLLLACLFAACCLPSAYAASVVQTPELRARLMVYAPQGIGPDKEVWLGLSFDHQRGWHTYWKNPGDSGLPTQLSWTLPAGVQAGDIDWPAPQRLAFGPLTNYGYEGQVLLPVPIQIDARFTGESLPIKLHAEWLVCKTQCIPESGDFDLILPTGSAVRGDEAKFRQALAARPRAWPNVHAQARIEFGALNIQAQTFPAAWRGKHIEFFPETAGLIDNAAPIAQRWDDDGTWRASVPLSAQRSVSPDRIPIVLVADGGRIARAITPISGNWADAQPISINAPIAAAPSISSSASSSMALAIVFALIGGALLNLMPCVFPVLSLKVLAFTRHAQQRRALALNGLAYSAGVLLSFVALAGLLLALRAAGEQLGWGFQLQSPVFVAALSILFVLIGLNLLGVFEFGSIVPSRVAAWNSRHPSVDAFLSGVLAVAIASPCTAPFMGASLGFALSLPSAQAITIFAALGVGMAAPYLAASLVPRFANLLPRPGRWMLHFKTLMAFPMFATVIWLLWVLGQQSGLDAAIALLATLLALAFAIWVWTVSALGSRARLGLGIPSLLLLLSVAGWALPQLRHDAQITQAAVAVEGWEPWSAQRVAEYTAQGRAVFVDFTAAWCVTCQYNKRVVLSDRQVLSAFKENNVALLRADWTRRDATIGAALNALERNGVPVYVLYPARERGAALQPKLLSELLSVAEVQSALDHL